MPDAVSKLIYPIYKSHLAPLRLLHFLALAILISRLTPPDWHGLMNPWMIAMIRCGENSLAIYCLGVLLSFMGFVILSQNSSTITAQVTENVFDSPSGRFLLVPQGTRLIGIYDSQVAFGQSRVLLVWTRLIMPNGRSIVIERQPGTDTAGYAGLEDEVDNHWGALFKAALLSTLLGIGSELGSTTGTGTNSDVITALRRGSGDSLNQTGQKVVQQNLNIQPTLTIQPGFPVRVIVNRDLVLEPYKG
jgi:type IV secretory pathway VirB10-like protein